MYITPDILRQKRLQNILHGQYTGDCASFKGWGEARVVMSASVPLPGSACLRDACMGMDQRPVTSSLAAVANPASFGPISSPRPGMASGASGWWAVPPPLLWLVVLVGLAKGDAWLLELEAAGELPYRRNDVAVKTCSAFVMC